MARGWESKAVAQQIEDVKREESPSPPPASGRDRQREAELESLRLSRSRLLDQLDKASHPAHREMLLKGLRAIEEQIEALSSKPPADETV